MRTIAINGALSALVFFCAFNSVFASDSIPADPKDTFYYMVFSARSPHLIPFSVGGHAFVSWGIKTGGDSVRSVHTYGFFPNEHSNLIAAVSKRKPGRVVRGFFKNSSHQKIRQMVVAVDYKTWNESLEASTKWEGRGYNLLDSNCLSFLDDMADQTELKTPDTKLVLGFPRTPAKYIQKLKKQNKRQHNGGLHVYDQEDRVCADQYVITED